MSAQQIHYLNPNTVTDRLDDYLIRAANMYMDNIRYGLESCVDLKEASLLSRLGDIVCGYDELCGKPHSNIEAAMQYINRQSMGLGNKC